jgi:hypothetical protein
LFGNQMISCTAKIVGLKTKLKKLFKFSKK